MVRGQYIAGTGMLLQRRLMENITNNISNADTTGYKKEHLVSHSFDEVLIERVNDPYVVGQTRVSGISPAGPMNMGTQIDQLYVDFSEGNLEGTERNTDMAIIGDAFFVVRTPGGERYTRSGAFYIDDLGYLVDGEGNYLLGENGPIYVGGMDFTVDALGGVWMGGSDEYADRVRVVSFANNDALRKQGSNLYFSLEAPQATPNQYRIAQRFLEGSNVDIGREMVDMLTVYRVYETNQRMLTMIDETVGRAVNDIGRLR
ncbi:MAG: flagellar hook-basal body complex protein [Oscillospiraceae bacterium]|nr:flagellar hook-basal body complex protein [Oscillospiraceae bacterium]